MGVALHEGRGGYSSTSLKVLDDFFRSKHGQKIDFEGALGAYNTILSRVNHGLSEMERVLVGGSSEASANVGARFDELERLLLGPRAQKVGYLPERLALLEQAFAEVHERLIGPAR